MKQNDSKQTIKMKQKEALPKIVNFIQSASKLDIHEEAHSKDGKDEHDQK